MTGIDYDVVCVGSGLGGAAAAAAAAARGARALILEKTNRLGGVTTHSSGQIWMPGNPYEREIGIEDSVEEGYEYLRTLADGWGDAELTRHLLTSALDALEFFRSRGFEARCIPNLADYYSPMPHTRPEGRYIEPVGVELSTLGPFAPLLRRSPFPQSGLGLGPDGAPRADGDVVARGEGLAAWFLRLAIEAGAEIWTEAAATDLVEEDGRVLGVVVDRGGESVVVRADAVVLATGGYDLNTELVRRYEGSPARHGSLVPPGIDGDGLTLGSRVGGSVYALPPQRNVMMLGFVRGDDEETVEGAPRHFPYHAARPGEIIVNRRGRRFANESFYPSVAAAVHAFDGGRHEYPNWPAWLVFDETRRRAEGPAAPVGQSVRADTLAELAHALGIDPDGLEETVARFNAASARGTDEFGRGEVPWVRGLLKMSPDQTDPRAMLGPISTPPFYGAPMERIFLGVPSAGLRIDGDARVVDERGEVIDGLYAVGGATGRNDLGICLQSGLPNLRSLTYGFLAGQDAASRAEVRAS
jgi:3-oxosteroid 1-dehydrogenase